MEVCSTSWDGDRSGRPLRNGLPLFAFPERTTSARILVDGRELQVAVFQDVDLVGATLVGLGAHCAVRRYEDLRPLESGFNDLLWLVLDKVSILRNVDGPILKELEVPLSTEL